MKSSKVLEWGIVLSPHQKPQFRWARLSPSFEKGRFMIPSRALKAKVAKGATDLQIKEAVKARLARNGEPTDTPIRITWR